MKLLNLDELVVVRRQVRLGGVDYNIADQTVGQMIDALQLAEEMEKVGEKVDSEGAKVVIGSLLETAKRLLPDCPEATLRKLSPKQIGALVEFASASDDEVIANSEVETKDDGFVEAGKTAP